MALCKQIPGWRTLCAAVLLLVVSSHLRAQSPGDILWSRIYGGDRYDEANAVQPTPEGGYIMVGYTQSFGLGRWGNGFVMKVDKGGDTLWTKQFGGPGSDVLVSVQVLSDSGYIMTGLSDSEANFEQLWLVRMNKSGAILWQKSYGGATKDIGYSVRRMSDGGFMIAGVSNSFGGGDEDFWLLRTNANGDSLWAKRYGTSGRDYGYDMKPTNDGGFIVTGPTNDMFVWLVKLNASGDTLWTRTFGGALYQESTGVIETSDGGFLISGSATPASGDLQALLVKTDSLGNQVWSRLYGTANYDEGRQVVESPSGGYLLAANGGYPDMQYWFVRVNATGDTLWTRYHGLPGTTRCFDIINADSGDFIAAGSIFDPVNDGDAALTRIKGDGSVSVEPHPSYPSSVALHQNYPNPFNPETQIPFTLSERAFVRLSIVDILGREVALLVNEVREPGNSNVTWNGRARGGIPLASGTYFSVLSVGGNTDESATTITRRMLILK
jgi:hypothetical protein